MFIILVLTLLFPDSTTGITSQLDVTSVSAKTLLGYGNYNPEKILDGNPDSFYHSAESLYSPL